MDRWEKSFVSRAPQGLSRPVANSEKVDRPISASQAWPLGGYGGRPPPAIFWNFAALRLILVCLALP